MDNEIEEISYDASSWIEAGLDHLDNDRFKRASVCLAVAQTIIGYRQAAALERIAAVLENMTNKGDSFLSVGVLK